MKALLAAAVIVASTPLVAAVAAGEGGRVEKQKDERVCRVIRDRTSASRMGPRRICMTARQWNQSTDADVDGDMDALGPRTRSQGRPDLPQ
jgi:hypothetical protein